MPGTVESTRADHSPIISCRKRYQPAHLRCGRFADPFLDVFGTAAAMSPTRGRRVTDPGAAVMDRLSRSSNARMGDIAPSGLLCQSVAKSWRVRRRLGAIHRRGGAGPCGGGEGGASSASERRSSQLC